MRKLKREYADEYLTGRQLGEVLGVPRAAVYKAIKEGRLTPDRSRRKLFLFHKDKLEEHKKSWKTKAIVSRTSESGVVVITPFGMIRPRAEPDAEVLAPLLLLTPKRISLRGFSRRTPEYNLDDLNSSKPSKRESRHIFASTSLKSVQIKRGKKTPPDT